MTLKRASIVSITQVNRKWVLSLVYFYYVFGRVVVELSLPLFNEATGGAVNTTETAMYLLERSSEENPRSMKLHVTQPGDAMCRVM